MFLSTFVLEYAKSKLIYDGFERGAILGRNKQGIISRIYLDTPLNLFENRYEPNIEALNKTIEQWMNESVDFCGMIHSHPHGYSELSTADIMFAKDILRYNDSLNELYFGVTQYKNDDFFIVMYLFTKDHDEITYKKTDLQYQNI